jgi:chemotaxis protein CheX
MKAETISPFIESVFELYATMLSCKVQRGEASVPDSSSRGHEVVALIGLSGAVRGSVALTFPVQTAMNIVSRLLGI